MTHDSLSHFLPRRTSRNGLHETATWSAEGNAQLVNAIRSSGTDPVASRRTLNRDWIGCNACKEEGNGRKVKGDSLELCLEGCPVKI